MRFNALTYTAAIAAAQKAGDLATAVRWLDEMSSRRELEQNELTLNAAVSTHSRNWKVCPRRVLTRQLGMVSQPAS